MENKSHEITVALVCRQNPKEYTCYDCVSFEMQNRKCIKGFTIDFENKICTNFELKEICRNCKNYDDKKGKCWELIGFAEESNKFIDDRVEEFDLCVFDGNLFRER